MKRFGLLVSVIVPVYNMEQRLERCLQSILQQTYANLEILAIDDGSTDRSLEIMRRYERQDARIQVFHQENRGVSAARNLGLEKTHGEYCTFIDSDDYVAKQYIEWLYLAIQQKHASMSICNGRAISDNETMPTIPLQSKPTIVDIPVEKYTLWGEASHAVCWGALYHKEIIKGLRFDTSLYNAEDMLYFFSALLKCDHVAFIKERPYYYVQYEYINSATRGKYTPKRLTEIDALQKICKLCDHAPPSLRNSVKAWYVMTCARNLTLMKYSNFNDPQKAKYLLHEIRKNVGTIWLVPNHKLIKKIRLLAYAAFPRLVGFIQWKYYLRKKIAVRD